MRDDDRESLGGSTPDLVCLSHLRWNFVFQRPQHLMSRFARERRVFFVEEPLPDAAVAEPRLEAARSREGVTVVTLRVPPSLPAADAVATLRRRTAELLAAHGVHDAIHWYYTPMALAWSEGLRARTVVYDCMDELSLFRGAPPELLSREEQLLRRGERRGAPS